MSNESAETRDQPESGSRAKRPGALAGALSVAALLAAFAALSLTGWYFWQRETPPDIRALEADRDAREAALARVNRELERVSGELQTIRARVAALEDRPDPAAGIRRLTSTVEDHAARQAVLERRVRELAVAVDEAGGLTDERERELAFNLGLLEAVALVRLGRDRLELVGDESAAQVLWQRAGQRLAALEEPRLGPPRRELARALELLESDPPVDWNALLGRVQAVSEGIERWPPRRPARPGPAAREAGPDEGWRGRLLAGLRQLVTVRPREEAGANPLEIELARERMRARMGVIELAAARGDAGMLIALAGRALEELEGSFDTHARAVVRARELLEELTTLPRREDLPALDAARVAIEQLQDLRR